MKERSYADLADSATNFDPELEFDKQVEKWIEESRKKEKSNED